MNNLMRCLDEIILSDMCPANVVRILMSVESLSDRVKDMNEEEFEKFFESEEFDKVSAELFNVTLNRKD